MAQRKTFQFRNRFWTLLVTVCTGMALSACGARSSGRFGSTGSTRWGTSGGTEMFSDTLLQGTGGGNLPTEPVTAASNPSSVGNPIQNFPGTSEGLLNLNQTANDFGLLNYCYSVILNRGKELLGSGTPADYVFKGAGQELYRCYNEVLQRRAQEFQAYQAYQQEQQMRDYWNAYFLAVLQSQMRGNFSDIQVTPPPSRGSVKKTGAK